MSFENYIKPELLILIPVLYLIGAGIKKSEFPNKFIPAILGFVSVVLSALYVFATDDIVGSKDIFTAIFTAVTQGILCAGASVYANQIVKQSKKEE